MRTGASSGPRTTVWSDGRRGCVADSVVGPDGDAISEPVPGDTTRDVSTNIVDIDHGDGVESLKRRAPLRRGHCDGGIGVDLCSTHASNTPFVSSIDSTLRLHSSLLTFLGDLLAGGEGASAREVQAQESSGFELLEVVGHDFGALEVSLDGLDGDRVVSALGGNKGHEGDGGKEGQGEHD